MRLGERTEREEQRVEAALVIGYGDRFRSDDGAGARVAERLTATEGIAVQILGQLVPELADDMRGRDVVVFVDATSTLEPVAVAVCGDRRGGARPD